MKKIIFFTIIFLITLVSYAQEQKIKHHYLSWKMSDMILERASFQYQFITGKEGKLGIYIPFSIHFGEYPHFNNNDPLSEFINEFIKEDEAAFYCGIGAKIYPIGQKMPLDFSIGAEVRFGNATLVSESEYNYNQTENIQTPEYEYSSYFYSAFLITPGVKYDIVNQLVVAIELGVGLRNKNASLKLLTAPGIYFGFFF